MKQAKNLCFNDNLFQKRKNNILKKKDKSNIGKIDKKILNLINLINSSDNYYTTSSCSGRIVILKKELNQKKDCKFLFCSHNKILKKDFKNIFKLVEIEKLGKNSSIFLKYEPLIIHICCINLDSAKKMLNYANISGFRRAGIITLNNSIIVEIIGIDFLETILKDNLGKYYDENILGRLLYYSNKKMQNNFNKIETFEKNIIKQIIIVVLNYFVFGYLP
jgi:tRNA wybutosine-synthesizing protein 3